jgi:hypothetical protein
MAKKSTAFTSTTLLGLAVGLFVLLSGVLNLVDQQSLGGQVAGLFADKSAGVVTVVVAILKIVSGAVLLIGPFGLLTVGIRKLAFWIIVGFWALLTLWLAVTTIGAFKGDAKAVLLWFETLALNVAILAALWQIKPEGK